MCGFAVETCTRRPAATARCWRTHPTGTSPRKTTGTSRMDLSHAATSRTAALEMVARMGDRLGARPPRGRQRVERRTSTWCRGSGSQPCAALLQSLAVGGYDGHVVIEVNTRRAMSAAEREADLAEALAFTRRHLRYGRRRGSASQRGARSERREARCADGAGPPSSEKVAGEPATRDRILSSARTEFAERGYDKASVRAIARGAVVDPALVHHYFGTKEAGLHRRRREGVRARPSACPTCSSRRTRDEDGAVATSVTSSRVWEEAATRNPLLAILRSAVTNETAAAIFRPACVVAATWSSACSPAGWRGRTRSCASSWPWPSFFFPPKNLYVIKVEPMASSAPGGADHGGSGPRLQRLCRPCRRVAPLRHLRRDRSRNGQQVSDAVPMSRSRSRA